MFQALTVAVVQFAAATMTFKYLRILQIKYFRSQFGIFFEGTERVGPRGPGEVMREREPPGRRRRRLGLPLGFGRAEQPVHARNQQCVLHGPSP